MPEYALQNLTCAGFAATATGRHAESLFESLQIGNALPGGMANFVVGDGVAQADVHISPCSKVIAMRIILIYINVRVKSAVLLALWATNISQFKPMDHVAPLANWKTHDQANRWGGLALVVFIHAAALAALLQYEPVRSALSEAMPIMVSLITPQPVVEKPQVLPKPLPVKPRVAQLAPPVPPQIITTTANVPEPAATPAPQPPAPIAVAPPPAPVPIAAAPVIPPNFSASYLENPAPAYPAMSRRVGEQGKVMLHVLVNAKGGADTVELRSSSGSSRLDDAALESVKRWRFVPARQGDQPVAAWVLIPITFSLKG